ncbi:hypothetical protein SYNPS1DRAFT_30680 [Syncephalis pseudoplumigaleata]|uniref:Cytochrome P450 n=1 Tax=Syncephalis pseudoplumigaleata TaxID=1712513 RepID=A0A4P9YUB9_9FUNG|nr:hypothetical protein SYNPS1DRAFT_30680 [Syncephalis pseudoplumigaleata]|eukprot:RKP23566.1 hypothetical protein SYNPS1DRAFT_30680 [Syncephalis pseudoplumigaleata]
MEGLIDQWNASYVARLLTSPSVLLALIFVIGVYYYSDKQHPNEPPKASYTIPFVGHGIEFLQEPNEVFIRCREKYGRIFSILLFGRWITIIDRSETWNVMRASEDQFSFSKALSNLMDLAFAFGDDYPHDRFHIDTLRLNLAKRLSNFNTRIVNKIDAVYKATVGDATKPYQMNNCVAFFENMVIRTMATCLAKEESIHNNEAILRMMGTVTRDVERTTLFKRILPTAVSRFLLRYITTIDKNIKVVDEVIVPEVVRRRQQAAELGDAYVPPVCSSGRP